MNENIQKLTDKQIVAVPFLLSDPCIERACKKANISKVTYYKWITQEAFKNELEAQQKAIVESAISKLKNCFSLAVNELYNLLGSKNENIRLRTAEKIIEFNLNIEEIKELEKRVESLELAANETYQSKM